MYVHDIQNYSSREQSDRRWSVTNEQETKLIVPSHSLELNEPIKVPVFFNPAAKFSRDISINIYRQFIDLSKKRITFTDSMCGLGARGLRVAKEIPAISNILFNDQDIFSIQITKINAIFNNVYEKCSFYNKEICKFSSTHFDYENRSTIVDLDPFGTPSPYTDCILRMVDNGGLVSITATDTAVLLGVYPKVCFRKYYGFPIRSKYSPEIGTRLLLSSIALVGSRLDLDIQPIFVHSYRNYIRVYCRVIKSNRLANKILEKLGYVSHCFNCGFRTFFKSSFLVNVCPLCDKKTSIAGPLWISTILDKDLINKILKEISNNMESDNNMNKHTKSSLENLQIFFDISSKEMDELPFYYLNDEFGKLMGRNTMSVKKIMETLNSNEFKSSRTLFSPTGFKTNAPMEDIKNLLRKVN